MVRFLGKALEIIESWSFARNNDNNPNKNVFNLVPVFTFNHWKSSYVFEKTNGKFMKFDHQGAPD